MVVPGSKSENPPKFTEMNAFSKPHTKTTRTFKVAFENDLFECSGQTSPPSSDTTEEPARYVVGTYNKQTDTVTFHESPVIQLQTHLKRLKSHDIPSELIGSKDYASRNLLGQTFGTRKKKMGIKAKEENKINVASMEHMSRAIHAEIEQKIVSIPTIGMILIDSFMLKLRSKLRRNVRDLFLRTTLMQRIQKEFTISMISFLLLNSLYCRIKKSQRFNTLKTLKFGWLLFSNHNISSFHV